MLYFESKVTNVSDLHSVQSPSPPFNRSRNNKLVSWNAGDSIRDDLDLDSNVTGESDLQSEKRPSHNTPTDEGIMISTKPVRLKISFSIHDNIDPDSNVTEENDRHKEKRPSPKTPTDE
jgi:hypothetical protein